MASIDEDHYKLKILYAGIFKIALLFMFYLVYIDTKNATDSISNPNHNRYRRMRRHCPDSWVLTLMLGYRRSEKIASRILHYYPLIH